MLGTDSLFTFNWQIALHGEPLTEEEMDQLAGAAAPILKLRGSWTVIDPAIARKARKRLVRTVKPGPGGGRRADRRRPGRPGRRATAPRRTCRSWSAPRC